MFLDLREYTVRPSIDLLPTNGGNVQTWFIAEGQLRSSDARGTLGVLESPFVNEAVARTERSQKLAAWKTAPREEGQGLVPSSMLWGRRGAGGGSAPPRFQYAVRAGDDALIYVVTVGSRTGLFRYHLTDKREVRLFHGAELRCLGMAYDPAADNVVLAVGNPDGTAALEIVDAEGRRRGQITGGDAIDAAPSVSAREPGVLFYQSAGVARHVQKGHVAAIGPAAILRLDTRAGQVGTVLEHRSYDFLAPKEDRGGNLWFIRRPYEKTAQEEAVSLGKDVLMFPWRLAKGIFGWLNFFTTIYGREPLRPSGGPKVPGMEQDMGALWLHGRMVELKQVQYSAERGGGLVPASWELVCQNRHGREYVAAKHVVSFDVAADDTVVYSNGFELYRLVDGDWQRFARANLVENVCAAASA